MLSMNELVELRMQQQIAHEIYRQQIMQRIPDPFAPMLPFHIPHHLIIPQRPTLPDVKAKLENDELWKEFHKIGTEMIITKSGRRMFPSMRVSVSELEDDSNYCVLLEMVPIGDCRYKFSGSHWIPAGGAEPQSPQRMFLHPDSPATGAHWQSQAIVFNKVKLTNNTLDNSGHIVLASMHKYQPRLHIIRSSDLTQLPWAPQKAFIFPETEFVAVTAYQNDRITKLKIDNNPFAKGFRETGQSRCKRKLGTLNGDEQDLCDNPSSPSKSSVASHEDDRSSLLNGQMGSPTTKRARSNGSCDDESYLTTMSSPSCGSLSPYYDNAIYSAMTMYQREHSQHELQLLSPSPLDIAAATYFSSRSNINPMVPQVNEIPPLLMQLPHNVHHRHPQNELASAYLQPNVPLQLATTLTSECTAPTNATTMPTTVPRLDEEQMALDSEVLLPNSISANNEGAAEPKQSKRNNFSISAILAFQNRLASSHGSQRKCALFRFQRYRIRCCIICRITIFLLVLLRFGFGTFFRHYADRYKSFDNVYKSHPF